MTQELQGGVPLERDLVKERLQFLPTYYEWLKKQEGIKIIGKTGSVNPTAINNFFTVPKGFVFYLETVSLSVKYFNSVGGSATIAQLLTEDGAINFVTVESPNGDGGNSISNNYPIPIKLQEGVTFQLESGAELKASATITGFLSPKELV